MQTKLSFIVLLGSLLLLFSCYTKPDFPDTPSISFNGFEIRTEEDENTTTLVDILTIKVDFQDGDGDLGVDDSEEPEFDNFIVNVFRLEGETFLEVDDSEQPYGGNFPRLNEEGVNNPLEGTIAFDIDFFYSDPVSTADDPLPFRRNTVLKFEVQILDRAMRASEVIETDTITIWREE